MTLNERDNQKWESGELGRDVAHARKAGRDEEAALEEAIAMQLISIRLPKPLLALLKAIAEVHGVGYQPMIRDVLMRWADGEADMITAQMEKAQKAAAQVREEPLLPERKITAV